MHAIHLKLRERQWTPLYSTQDVYANEDAGRREMSMTPTSGHHFSGIEIKNSTVVLGNIESHGGVTISMYRPSLCRVIQVRLRISQIPRQPLPPAPSDMFKRLFDLCPPMLSDQHYTINSKHDCMIH